MSSLQISNSVAQGLNLAADRHNALIYLMSNVLVSGRCENNVTIGDYGLIPGCPKPVLFKQGAEKLADAFGLRVILEKTQTILEKDFVHYEFAATVYNQATLITTHVGACNTEEKGIVKTLDKMKSTPRGYAHNVACRAEKRAYVGGVIKALAATQYFAWDQETYDILPTDRPFEGVTIEGVTIETPTSEADLETDIRNLAKEICTATGHTTQQLRTIAVGAGLPVSSAEMTWDQAIQLQRAAIVKWITTRYMGITENQAFVLVEELPDLNPSGQIAILKTKLADWQ